jgi:MYXO-CTERM domain-containing protein
MFASGAIVTAALASTRALAQPTVGRNFTGSNINVTGAIPPDSMGAVGPDHYIEFVNGRFAIFRKGTGALLLGQTDSAFWNSAGVSPAELSDPRVIYDHRSGRWFASEAELGGSVGIMVAVSQTSDPTGAWTGFFVDPNNNALNDFPRLGVNADAVTLTSIDFNPTATNTEALVSIPKADLLAASPTIANRTVFPAISIFSTGSIMQPVTSFGPSNGNRTTTIATSASSTAITVRGTFANVAGPGAATFSSAIGVNVFADTNPPLGFQPDGTRDLHTGDRRYSGEVYQVGSIIYSVHSTQVGGRAAIRWYKIDETTNTMIQGGTISDLNYDFCYPSIGANENGDVVIGYSRSGTSAVDGFISSYASVGTTTGGVTTFGAPMLLKAGVANYHIFDGTRNRWGDYSAVSMDPSDPGIFWTTQEWVQATNVWALQHTEIVVPAAGEVRWNAAAAAFNTGSNWIGGNVPTASDHIIFSRPTEVFGPGFTVTGAGAMAGNRMSVRQGRLSLDLGGGSLTLSNTSTTTPSLSLCEFNANPQLTVRNGTLSTVQTQLSTGSFSGSTMFVSAATWNNSGNVIVGGTPAASGGGTASMTIGSPSAATLNVAGTFKVWNGGSVLFQNGAMTVGNLDITGGVVQMSASPVKVLRTGGVSITGGGRVDISNQQMTVDYSGSSPIASIASLVLSGYNGGAFNAPGITTTFIDAAHAIGFREASAFSGNVPAVFGTVDSDTILIRRVRFGDANLDGTVDLIDFNALAASFGQSGKFWQDGDFNYTGTVDLIDFNALAAQFGLSGSPDGPTPQDWANLAAVVPEPSIAGLSLLALAALHRRRR